MSSLSKVRKVPVHCSFHLFNRRNLQGNVWEYIMAPVSLNPRYLERKLNQSLLLGIYACWFEIVLLFVWKRNENFRYCWISLCIIIVHYRPTHISTLSLTENVFFRFDCTLFVVLVLYYRLYWTRHFARKAELIVIFIPLRNTCIRNKKGSLFQCNSLAHLLSTWASFREELSTGLKFPLLSEK